MNDQKPAFPCSAWAWRKFEADKPVRLNSIGALSDWIGANMIWLPTLIAAIVVDIVSFPFRINAAEQEERLAEAKRRDEAEKQRREQEQAERRRLERELEAEKRQNREEDDGNRREDARFACQMLYDRHRTTLAQAFPPSQLQQYFDQYLSDRHSVEHVEQRAEQLKTMLQEIVSQHERGDRRFASLVEIRQHFHDELQRVSESDFDDDLKQTLLADLARDEERAMREFRQQ